MVLPRVALTAEEVAAAVGQQAMVIQELASALVEIRQPVVLGFPSAQALRRFFVARRERPRLCEKSHECYDSFFESAGGSDECQALWKG
jgi:hypothetical protein